MSSSPAGGQQDGPQPPPPSPKSICQSGFAMKKQLKNFQLRTGQHQNLVEQSSEHDGIYKGMSRSLFRSTIRGEK